MTSNDPQRFAQLVLEAFARAGNVTDSLVARAKGPSTSTMTRLRKVAKGDEEMAEPREPTWSNIDSAAGWTPGSARRVWAGGDPEPVGGGLQDERSYVAAPGARVDGGVDESEVLRAIESMSDAIREMSERLAKLEKRDP